GSAALPGSSERTPDSTFNREVDVSVVHYDDDVFAAHLERTDRVAIGAGRSDDAAGFSRAGERNQTQRWMIGDRSPGIFAVAGHQINNSGRHSRFFAGLDQVVG